jgi:Ca2+-binding RTX toxin-like protein
MLVARPLVLALILPAIALASPVAASAPGGTGERARPTCLGHRATLVGSSDRFVVVGTRGRDVIVSNGSNVAARGGNDLICVTARASSHASVDGGGGDDRVTVLDPLEVTVDLGPGDDHLVGSYGPEQVVDAGTAREPGQDTIETRGGRDEVILSGRTGADRVLLGRGDDSLYANVGREPRAVLAGGAGSDFLLLNPPDRPIRSLLVDNRRERATRNDARVLRWDSFEEFGLWAASADSQRFIGSGADETVWFGATRVAAHLGGGDDVLDLPAGSTARDLLSGGPGVDTVRADLIEAGVVLDLAAQLVTIGPPGSAPVPLASFESGDLLAPQVQVLGGDGPNDLQASGCEVVVDAAGGDDTVHADRWWDPESDRQPACAFEEVPTLSFDGGAGDDALAGSRWDDTLVGGDGRDLADGRAGTDACQAETEQNCESDPPPRARR